MEGDWSKKGTRRTGPPIPPTSLSSVPPPPPPLHCLRNPSMYLANNGEEEEEQGPRTHTHTHTLNEMRSTTTIITCAPRSRRVFSQSSMRPVLRARLASFSQVPRSCARTKKNTKQKLLLTDERELKRKRVCMYVAHRVYVCR